jgi:type III restriction enzyme
VLQKAEAAKIYCQQATEYALKNGKKTWEYVLIPHDKVKGNMTLEGLRG